MNTHSWYERLRNQVEQSGTTMQRIVFSYGPQTWHVWDRPQNGPWPEADDWQREVDVMLEELAEQWPAKIHQCVFVAENKNGTVISQCPVNVQGRNKSANSVGQDATGFKQLMDSVGVIQATWEKTLNVVNSQLEIQAKQLKHWGDQVGGLMQYVRESEEYRATEARRKLEDAKVNEPDPLKEQLVEAMPMLLELGKHWAEAQIRKGAATVLPNSTVGKVAKAAVETVVSETLNNTQGN